jgi:hypothetical protein
MNSALATTGLQNVVLGTVVTFTGIPKLCGLPWDLTLGTGVLLIADPAGNITTVSAQVGKAFCKATWKVAGAPGVWNRCWQLTDMNGVQRNWFPIAFGVVAAPVASGFFGPPAAIGGGLTGSFGDFTG